VAHCPINVLVGNVGICLITDAAIDQSFKDLVAIPILVPVKELFLLRLHSGSPEEVPQVAISEHLLVPSITLKIIDGSCSRVQPSHNASTGMSESTGDVTGDGVPRSPVLVVEGGKLVSHVGSEGWLLAKVDSEHSDPIPSLYTIDFNIWPNTSDWLCQSRSPDSPSG